MCWAIYDNFALYFSTSMAHCIKEFEPLDPSLQAKIRDRIFADQAPSYPSLLYDTHDKSKIYNLERRSSSFRLFSDFDLFKDCDALVKLLSDRDPSFTYSLRHNDVTHIHYAKDDFFEAHTDYLSLTSNHVQEFTLIMCLGATCEGGETRFTLNPFCSLTSKASVTQDYLVLFRKDITHEGLPLLSGTKDIMTLNLWGMPKQNGKDKGKTLVISFPDSPSFYAISWAKVKMFPHCFFAGWASFGKIEDQSDILDYSCTVATYEDMKIIVDILTGSHIKMDDYMDRAELVKFFGFNQSDLLLEISEVMQAEKIPQKTCLTLKPSAKASSLSTKHLKLVFADSEDALTVLNRRIREDGLNALTFAMGFVEGNTDTVKEEVPNLMDLDGSHFKLMCAEFGECRQLLSYYFPSRYCHTADELNVGEQLDLSGFQFEEFEMGYEEDEEDGNSITYSEDQQSIWYGLRCGPDLDGESSMASACSSAYEADSFYFRPPYTTYHSFNKDCGIDNGLPYVVLEKDSDDEEEYKDGGEGPKGVAFLDRPRQEALNKILEEFNVVDEVIKALPTLGLRFPQERINDAAGLCNETLYLNFSLVYVYGIMFFE